MAARIGRWAAGLATVAMLIAGQALAGERHADATAPDECTCRGGDGRPYLLGERTCLRTERGLRIAECAMVLNNTSWRVSERPCPDS